MKKVLLCLICIIPLILSGCSLLLSQNYPDNYTKAIIAKADEYLEKYYPTIYNDQDLECTGCTVTRFGSNNISCVTYLTSERTSLHIWNSLTDPFDDIAYKLYSPEAISVIEPIAYEVFGTDIDIELADLGYYTASSTRHCQGVYDFLATPNACTVLIALPSDDMTDKLRLVEAFRDKLQNADIYVGFGIYFYEKYSEMQKDFNPDKAILGRGDFKSWVFSVSPDEELKLNGSGIPYRKSKS